MPTGWHDFFLAAVGAGATLTGLAFVAISVHPREIGESTVLRARAVGAILAFTSILFTGLVMVIPPPASQLAYAVLGVIAVVVLFGGIRIQLTQVRHRVGSRSFIRWALHGLGSAGIAGASLSLAVRQWSGLYVLLAAALLLLLGNGLWQSWLLVLRLDESGSVAVPYR